jgi:hypothetical protein
MAIVIRVLTFLSLGTIGVFATGCAGTSPKSPPAPKNGQIVVTSARQGGVVQMVTEFRFVVLNFAGAYPPSKGTVLDVVRDGRKVGRVMVDGASREFPTLMTADIIEGEVRKGDDVRVELTQRPPLNTGTTTPARAPSNIVPRRPSR